MSKKKILLLSDDLRMSSGVGTVSKNFVLGTLDKYDWVQAGGAIKHPEEGKVVDMNDSVRKETGVEDASLKIYPISGYGNQELLRNLINIENPDAILHYTDPRFWGWLYAMEHELRHTTPIMYYNIWDDLPFPHWNEPFYESCDALMAISKQTYNINKHVCQNKPRVEGVDLNYVQHGIDEQLFKPISKESKEYLELKQNVLNNKDYDFIAFFNNLELKNNNQAMVSLHFDQFGMETH